MTNQLANLARPGPRPAFTPASVAPQVERIGPSYRVSIDALTITFREVRTDRELSADVSVAYGGRHVVRTTSTLSLTARGTLAKTTARLVGMSGDEAESLHRAVFAAVEAVLVAEEATDQAVDMRTADLSLPSGAMHVLAPGWPVGSVSLVAPGEAGKSTISRALAVSIATGREVVPGFAPVGRPRPVLYVAGEDAVPFWHARSVEAICRGIGIERASMAERIELYDSAGRPLHRIARAIGERAGSFGAVVLDSQQTLLAQLDGSGGIRDRDSLFWNAVDQLTCPVLIVAHPNRSDSRNWREADGRVAGSEVNRDRARMLWTAHFDNEPAITGTSFRRYSLTNVKNSHGARVPPIGFGMTWQFGTDGDPGTVTFRPTDPQSRASDDPEGMTPTERATVEAIRSGIATVADLARHFGITEENAKKRRQRVARFLTEEAES